MCAKPDDASPPPVYHSIRPGKIWLDTGGKRIQAHGGSMLVVDGVFYWYGENKEKTLPGSGIWHDGVRMYRSHDLYNWEDLGVVLAAEPEDKASPLHPAQCMDRPHILYCAESGRYVMWIKIMGKDGTQFQTLAVADRVTGPYERIRSFRPLGMSCGDFDLAVEPGEGKAYYIFERVHSELICADLTADYTDVTGYYSTHFHQPFPPYVREAPAYFRRKHLHYLITSGTTGYFPNRSEAACAPGFHGPWKVLGDPHPGDPEHCSFHSQITSVFKHPGKKDLYIALADRWLTDLPTPLPDADEAFRRAFDPETADFSLIKELETLTEQNTSVADYVWLPLRFEGDMPILDWHDEWRIEDYD